MENASKALIIAGAILISILLISVGILVMNSASGVQDEMASQMDATQKQSFNAQFSNYSGTNKTASDVRALYNTVNSSNATHDDSTRVVFTINGAEPDATAMANLSTRTRYTIVVTIDNAVGGTGLVNNINVIPANATSGGSSTPVSSH